MKKLMLALIMCVGVAAADELQIKAHTMGSGVPGESDPTVATEVYGGVFHAPQYMPGYPTAAPIWARVIKTPCNKNGVCDSYSWRPGLGRGEYLMFEPTAKAEPKTVIREVPVYIERKKKGE